MRRRNTGGLRGQKAMTLAHPCGRGFLRARGQPRESCLHNKGGRVGMAAVAKRRRSVRR